MPATATRSEKKTGRKASKPAKKGAVLKDLSESYNEFKEFEGRQ